MDIYRGFITYSDSEGSYSEAGEFPASNWTDALDIGMKRAVDIVRGDDLTIHQTITRGQANSIQSASIRVKNEDGNAVLLTLTEA